MGYILNLTCKCNYNKNLYLGSGMFLPDENMVFETFPKEKITDFTKAFEDKTLTFFYIEQKMAFCPTCNEIVASPVLCFQIREESYFYHSECNECKGTLEFHDSDEKCTCPLCGLLIAPSDGGMWD